VIAGDEADGLERIEAGRERVRQCAAAPETIFDDVNLLYAVHPSSPGCVTAGRRPGQRERSTVSAITLLSGR